MIVLGCDPGARGTGIVLADTRRRVLLYHTTVRRPDEPLAQVSPAHLVAVTANLVEFAAAGMDRGEDVLVAVEGVVAPNPHVNRGNGRATTNVDAILATAMVFGAVMAWAHEEDYPLVVIRPGSNGSQLLGTYPEALVSGPERTRRGWETRPAGDGKLKDQRSAWDVALAGPITYRALCLHAERTTPATPYSWS